MLYINKDNGKYPAGKDWTWIDDIYYHDENNVPKVITSIHKNGKLLWELIIGFLKTKDGFTLKTKNNFILKCKNQ